MSPYFLYEKIIYLRNLGGLETTFIYLFYLFITLFNVGTLK